MSARLLGEVEVGSVVKLNVDGTPTNFIVVNQGIPQNDTTMYDASCNGTWVLMQDVYEEQAFSDGSNSYADGSLNDWLNTNFISLLDEDIQGAIPTVKIPYRPGSGISATVNTGESGLPVKAFILSCDEVNLYDSGWMPNRMGAALSYFPYDGHDGDSLRVAYLNGVAKNWWTRTPFRNTSVPSANTSVNYILTSGYRSSAGYSTDGFFVRPAMILPLDWYVLEDGAVIINSPPTAPSSIDVTGVVIGESATITLTAATDPDGTVESYIYERQVDGGEEWVQISQTSSLTCQDPVSEDWGTVAYRACAVDDKGVAGPYITSETFEVNAGWVVISGPAEAMGDKPGPFDFAFSLNVTGSYGAETIHYSAALDGVALSSGSAAPGQAVTLSLDTRLMATGTHSLSITASAELFAPAYKTYTFSVPAVELPGGGRATQFKNPQGKALFPVTLGRLVIGPGGVDYNTLFGRQADRFLQLTAGSYTGTGTSGAEAPTRLVFGFVPSLVLVTPGAAAAPALIWCGQSGGDGLTFAQQGSALSWYASSAAAQINESNTEYHYLALGRKEDAE